MKKNYYCTAVLMVYLGANGRRIETEHCFKAPPMVEVHVQWRLSYLLDSYWCAKERVVGGPRMRINCQSVL